MSSLSRSRLFFLILSGLLVVPLLSGAFLAARPAAEEDSFYKYLSVFTEVLRLVRKAYVEEPDLGLLMSGAMDGATDALDPFSLYVPEGPSKGFDRVDRIGRSHSGLLVLKDRGVALAVAVDAASPADEVGVKRGDIVSKINGRSTRDMPLWQIRELLAGPVGQRLRLEVLRQADVLDKSLVLGPFEVPQPSFVELEGYGVIRLNSFRDGMGPALDFAIQRAGELPLLLDIRGVAGGDPASAYASAGRFTKGAMGKLVGRDGVQETFSGQPAFSGEPASSDAPGQAASATAARVAVLVDRGTQGAAEIFAAVLSQGAGATLVGERTFGHAGRTERLSLSSGAFVELTRAFYTGPDGELLNSGLEPDLVVRGHRSFGEEEDDEDEMLKRALEALEEEHQKQRTAA